MFVRKIQENRNSFFIFLPRNFCRHLQLKKGDYLVVLLNEKNQLILDKLTHIHYPELAKDYNVELTYEQ